MLTHPIDEDAERFYLRSGSEPSSIREQQLLLLLKNARSLILSCDEQAAHRSSGGHVRLKSESKSELNVQRREV
jgi:hypothetical protein